MATITTTYLGNLRTEAVHVQSGSKLITDAPLDNHGDGEYFSPTDLFAASLGCCMLTIMGISANAHGFDVDGATVETTKVMAVNPRRVGEFIVNITLPHNKYSEKERRLIEAAARECPVHNSLRDDIKLSLTISEKAL